MNNSTPSRHSRSLVPLSFFRARISGTPAFGQTTSEPLSKTYRVTRANDVEFQKVEPFKEFDRDAIGSGLNCGAAMWCRPSVSR